MDDFTYVHTYIFQKQEQFCQEMTLENPGLDKSHMIGSHVDLVTTVAKDENRYLVKSQQPGYRGTPKIKQLCEILFNQQ